MILLSNSLILMFILFSLGNIGVLIRKNIIFILFSLEIIINSSAAAFIMVGSYWKQVEGHIMYIIIITTSAAEAGIILSLILQISLINKKLNINEISEIKK
ncbi:NADH-quinone oxidoreductase subunit NuoK [Sodalis-like secondary symbiont of Drepanosiphum platanoidis]|uniref:NADH-quinone oxidoreductase subunit NuoK n=1 Tax=Sodalis-like secondary symbiont of Drepanosiphum platanoidis TaxID=2994493 RepID=UPI0034639430